jgi:hypothetical protein
MHLIQPILLLAFLGTLFSYVAFLRTALRDRLIAVILFCAACVAVLIPDSTQKLANMVGVGRGTDLTFYLLAVGFVFFGVVVHSKISEHARVLTEVVRTLAISEAVVVRGDDAARPSCGAEEAAAE